MNIQAMAQRSASLLRNLNIEASKRIFRFNILLPTSVQMERWVESLVGVFM